MRHAYIFAALLTIGGTGVAAQAALEPVLEQLRNQGLTDIEVTREAGKVRVEAKGGGFERELVYDARTGSLLEDEYGPERISLLPREGETEGAEEEDEPAMMPMLPPASAALTAAGSIVPVIEALRADGYSRIEVAPEGDFIRLEAVRDGFRRELAYDAVSGELLSDVMRPDLGEDDEDGGAVDANIDGN